MTKSIMLLIMALFGLIEEEIPTTNYTAPISLIEYCRILETPIDLNPDQADQLFQQHYSARASK